MHYEISSTYLKVPYKWHSFLTTYTSQIVNYDTSHGKLKWSNQIVTGCCIGHIGTRMWRRGANLEGDSANFIETEQLLEFEGFRSSLLQVLLPLGICLQIMIVPVDMFSTQYLEWISPLAMLFLGPCLTMSKIEVLESKY